MSTPECFNPLRREFWLGTVDPRPLALFRIALGAVVLHDLLDYTRDFRAFITDEGMLPRSIPRPWSMWSIFDLAGSPAGVAALYAVGVLALLAFVVGYRTRVATFASWLCLVSLHNRNYFVTDGGDDFVAIMFFWSMFADLAGCWSLDARRRRVERTPAAAFGFRILQANVAVLYFVTARLKLRRGWLHGTAIYQVLQFDGFLRPMGAWLEGHPTLCGLSTYGVLAMEFAFPFFAFSPIWGVPTRTIALSMGLAIQLGILLSMRVGIFTEAMLASCALFVLPRWLDAVDAWLRQRRLLPERAPAGAPGGDAPPAADLPRWRLWLYGAVALQFVFTSWDFFAGRRLPLPRFIHQERTLLSLEQPGDLFGTIYDVPYWEAPGVLVDGTPVEVLGVAAPGAHVRGAGITFSRWTKFTFKERDNPAPWPTLARYLCRAYDERSSGPRLGSFRVIDNRVRPRLPGEDQSPPQPKELWRQDCE